MRARRHLTATAALAAAAGLVLIPVTAASATEFDIETPGWIWEEVDDEWTSIDDVSSFWSDIVGSGLDVEGWTDDAFDDFPDSDDEGFQATFNDSSVSWEDAWLVDTPGTVSGDVFTNVISNSTGDIGDGNQLDVTVTLTIEGSFATWDFDFTVAGPDAANWEFIVEGNLGSDGDSIYLPVGSNGMVSYEDSGFDPILGWSFTGDGAFVVSNSDDDVVVEFQPSTGDAGLTVAVAEFDPCGFDAALAGMQSYVPQFATIVGSVIDPYYSDDCVTLDGDLVITAGSPTTSTLAIQPSAALDDYWNRYFAPQEDSGDGWSEFELALPTIFDGPEGLEAEVVWDDVTESATLQFSGTVTSAAAAAHGDAPIRIMFTRYYQYTEGGVDDEPEYYEPLFIEVDASVELAATGAVDTTSMALGAALLVALGAGALLVVRRRVAQR